MVARVPQATFGEFIVDVELPKNATTQVYAFMGKRGSGKTYGAGRLAEVFLERRVQTIVIDPVGNWWGLRLGADGVNPGFDIPVLGGEHGDIPLSPDAGEIVADMLVDTGSSAVLDVSPFSKSARKKFIERFAEHFFQRKKTRRSSVHVFIEEAHLVLPQSPGADEKRMLGALEDLVRLGRNYGIGVSMLDQRPQSVSKEALNQAEVLLAFQLIGAHERDAIKRWVDYHSVGADLARLSKLTPGQVMTWAPWLETPGICQIAQKVTFDSSKTPEDGEEALDVELKPLDLDALRTAMEKAGVDVAKHDPKTVERLRTELDAVKQHRDLCDAEVKSLTTRLDAAYAALDDTRTALGQISAIVFGDDEITEPNSIVDGVRDLQVHRAGFDANDLEVLTEAKLAAQDLIDKLHTVLVKGQGQLGSEALPKIAKPKTTGLEDMSPDERRRFVRDVVEARATPSRLPRIGSRNHDAEVERVAKGAERTFAAAGSSAKHLVLAAYRYMNRPLRAEEVALLTGYSAGASTIGVYISEFKRDGLLEQGFNGGAQITKAGLKACRDAPDPVKPFARIQKWIDQLGRAGEALIHLRDAYPNTLTHAQLCKLCKLSPDASTMGVYLSKLKKKGLIVGRGSVSLNPLLYLEP